MTQSLYFYCGWSVSNMSPKVAVEIIFNEARALLDACPNTLHLASRRAAPISAASSNVASATNTPSKVCMVVSYSLSIFCVDIRTANLFLHVYF